MTISKHAKRTSARVAVPIAAVILGALTLPAVAVDQAPPPAQPTQATTLDVVVTVPPLKGLVEPLLPAGSHVSVLMKPGRSEHGYELTPEDLVRVARADVFVYVGLHLEARVERVLEKRGGPADRPSICFAEVVGEQGAHAVDAHDHEEQPGAEDHHDHEHTPDPHLWLDPQLVKQLVPAIADRLARTLKAKGNWSEEDARALDARKDALIARVEGVDKAYRERLEHVRSRSIITHHDAFSRTARRYNLQVAAVIRVGTSGESSPGDLAKVLSAARESGARAIFREPQFDAKAAERLAKQAGVRLLVLDPLGDGDWVGMMEHNLDALCEGLGEEKPAAAPAKDEQSPKETPR